MRYPIISILVLILTLSGSYADKAVPKINDGIWDVNFMYWSSLSPAVEGTGSITILCEVANLGEVKTEPREYQAGELKVLELLSSSAKELKNLKTINIDGCEGLKVKDRVIICIGIEGMPNGKSVYCVLNHRGTNCSIGHRLSHKDEESFNKEDNKALLELAKKGFPSIDKLTTDELRTFSIMDPDGVREALIRKIEIKNFKMHNNK